MFVRLEDVSHNYGDFYLFYDVNLVINPKDKIALIGKNGSGKTTLLNIIYGNLEPIEGQVIKKNNLNISILKQYRADNDDLSIYNFIKEAVLKDYAEHMVDRITRSLLVGVGFSEEQWDRKVSTLSGGE
ncbi:MAG: ATP-binding cassette domain-containing protein, partial [Defluviitoga tunisiensis]